jgi:hypothetical protein
MLKRNVSEKVTKIICFGENIVHQVTVSGKGDVIKTITTTIITQMTDKTKFG